MDREQALSKIEELILLVDDFDQKEKLLISLNQVMSLILFLMLSSRILQSCFKQIAKFIRKSMIFTSP